MFSKLLALGATAVTAVMTSAITITAGKIALEEKDKTAIDTAVTGSISSYWDLFMVILPYIAIFAVLGITIGYLTGLVRFGRR